jgi:hypothetical protein
MLPAALDANELMLVVTNVEVVTRVALPVTMFTLYILLTDATVMALRLGASGVPHTCALLRNCINKQPKSKEIPQRVWTFLDILKRLKLACLLVLYLDKRLLLFFIMVGSPLLIAKTVPDVRVFCYFCC